MTAEGRPYADTTPPRLWLLGMSVAVLLALAVLAHSFETQTLDLFMLRLDSGSAVLAWIGLMVVVAICMLAVLIRLYHVRHNHDSRVAGGLVLLTGIVLVFHATHLASLVISAKDIQAAYVAADEQDNAGVFALSNGRLQVIGPVGNSLFSDILALDDPQSPVKVIEIASEGGLIDVALQLARFVEDRRISVVVTNICLSACVLIAVASAESQAEEGAIFGFHPVSPLAEPRTEIARNWVTEINVISNAFLKAHGVPDEMLAEASKYGSDEVLEVSARRMVEVGAIKYLMADGKIIATGPKAAVP